MFAGAHAAESTDAPLHCALFWRNLARDILRMNHPEHSADNWTANQFVLK